MLALSTSPLSFASGSMDSKPNRIGSKPNMGSKPNIAFMLIDDLGWANTEYGGSGDADFGHVKTPVFKQLASKSVKLDNHYAYAWCAPSRSSLLSGRLPVHVNVNRANPTAVIKGRPGDSGEGIPAGMSTIGGKLKDAGYATHYVGKWGVGYTWKEQTPMARGFDSFFGYYHDSCDYWDQKQGADAIEKPIGCEAAMRSGMEEGKPLPMAVDLIRNWGPAYGENGTDWVDYLFLNESLKLIAEHDTSTPFFLLHSFHSVHAPLNAPHKLYEAYDDYLPAPCPAGEMRTCFKDDPSFARNSYASMITFVDHAIGDVIDTLKYKGMWTNTLMVVSSDNGGPQYLSEHGYQMWGGGNNLPLRGGKTSEFQGGIRVNSFVTGGLLPEKMHGKTLPGLIHFADWYGTFLGLAGGDTHDDMAEAFKLPQPDAINQWEYISGETATPPRTEIMVSPVTLIKQDDEGLWKLLTGPDPGSINQDAQEGFIIPSTYSVGYPTGWPNKDVCLKYKTGSMKGQCVEGPSTMGWPLYCQSPAISEYIQTWEPEAYAELKNHPCPAPLGYNCTHGCLFNLAVDQEESNDLGKNEMYKKKHEKMWDALKDQTGVWTPETKKGIFDPIRNGGWIVEGSIQDKYPNQVCDDSAQPGCTNLTLCAEFIKTGYYSWAAEATHWPFPY